MIGLLNAPYDGGLLLEIIVKPSYLDKKLLLISSRVFKNKTTRLRIYNTVDNKLNSLKNRTNEPSFNEVLLNTINLFNKSGRPSINSLKHISRPFYNPVTNSLNLTISKNLDNKEFYPGLVPELSHAFLYNNNIKHPKLTNSPIDGKTTYHKIGSLEHLAHTTIEPRLNNYIITGNNLLLNHAINLANREYENHGNYWF